MTLSSDATQPKSPFKQQDNPAPFLEPEPQETGPGCLVWGIVGTLCILMALAIVGLAGAAGWTTGQRTAQLNATATQDGMINNQINKIATEVSQGNVGLVQYRVEAMGSLVPNHPQVQMLVQTATALYMTNQPTVTPTATATLTPTETPPDQPAATEEPTIVMTAGAEGQFDPADLLAEARSLIAQDKLDDAIEVLEVIITIDPNYERVTVTDLMIDTLSDRALQLFRGGNDTQLARAIRLTDRAEDFGTLREGLSVERLAATLYLNAKATIGTSDFTKGLGYLQELNTLSPGYRNGEIRQMLFSQYSQYGDALVAQGQPCSAVSQYNNALNVMYDAGITGKRDAAQITCEQGTPTPATGGDPNAATAAPIGSQGG